MAQDISGIMEGQGPFAINLDETGWNEHLDNAALWLGNVITTQTTFRKLLETAVPKIREPNIRLYLQEMLQSALRHERLAYALFEPIGREPMAGRRLAGTVLSSAHKVAAAVEGIAGGAAGNWRDIRQLLIANLDAMGAFAVAEQIGLVLANRDLRDLAFIVTCEKSSDQLVLQEIMLEMASASIFYKTDV